MNFKTSSGAGEKNMKLKRAKLKDFTVQCPACFISDIRKGNLINEEVFNCNFCSATFGLDLTPETQDEISERLSVEADD